MCRQTEGLRKVGRPGARWRDEVGIDETMLGMGWWAEAVSAEEGRNFLKEAKIICAL
jgi:hypothetical protein